MVQRYRTNFRCRPVLSFSSFLPPFESLRCGRAVLSLIFNFEFGHQWLVFSPFPRNPLTFHFFPSFKIVIQSAARIDRRTSPLATNSAGSETAPLDSSDSVSRTLSLPVALFGGLTFLGCALLGGLTFMGCGLISIGNGLSKGADAHKILGESVNAVAVAHAVLAEGISIGSAAHASHGASIEAAAAGHRIALAHTVYWWSMPPSSAPATPAPTASDESRREVVFSCYFFFLGGRVALSYL